MTEPILIVDTKIFGTLLPGKSIIEANRLVNKYGYTVYCALNDGVQRPNTWKNAVGGVYVEIRAKQIHNVLRIIPLT